MLDLHAALHGLDVRRDLPAIAEAVARVVGAREQLEPALPVWIDFIKGAVELNPEFGGRNFECPEGIKFVEIDADLGTLSTPSCPHRELIAVTERLAPNLECLLHGNLPGFGDGAGEASERADINETLLAQHSRSSTRASQNTYFPATRVDVDARGRRTLVNAMR